MAYYENLPIYRKAMQLAVYMEQVVHGFPRYHKYAIGADLRNLSKKLVSRIIQANSVRDKQAVLTELRDLAEQMKTTIIIGKEISAFKSFKQFQQAAALAVDVCRQAEGWLKSCRGRMPESGRNQSRPERAKDHCAPVPPRT
jgi:hypothetical protein